MENILSILNAFYYSLREVQDYSQIYPAKDRLYAISDRLSVKKLCFKILPFTPDFHARSNAVREKALQDYSQIYQAKDRLYAISDTLSVKILCFKTLLLTSDFHASFEC